MHYIIRLNKYKYLLLNLELCYSFLIDTCSVHQECIPALECPYTKNLLELALEAKDVGNEEEKTKIISDIQLQICGDKKDRTVCCDLDDEEDVPETLPKR